MLHQTTGFLAEADIDILPTHIQAARGKTAGVVAYLEVEGSETSVESTRWNKSGAFSPAW